MRVSVGVWIGPPTVSAWAKPASSSMMTTMFGASAGSRETCGRHWCLDSASVRPAWLAEGSGGNGSGFLRTISSSVRSVRSPASRSSITSAPKRVAPTPSPV